MASASISSDSIVDPRKNAKFKIQLGSELQQDDAPEYKYASVKCKLQPLLIYVTKPICLLQFHSKSPATAKGSKEKNYSENVFRQTRKMQLVHGRRNGRRRYPIELSI